MPRTIVTTGAPKGIGNVAVSRLLRAEPDAHLVHEYARRLPTGIDVVGYNPGFVPGTDLARDAGALSRFAMRRILPLMTLTPMATTKTAAGRYEDTVLGGRQIRRGDWVVMYYASANRDENVFPDPWTFDITRKPNGHVAFGGGGPHFCLGSFLAKMMLRHMFDQLFHRVPGLTLGTPELLIGNFAGAVKRLPASTGCPVAH